MSISNYKLVFIKNEYFEDYPELKEILKSHKKDESNRIYFFLNIQYKNNNIFIPLRSEIDLTRSIGTIGFPIPGEKRPNAGLDYRKILIINDISYIEFPPHNIIPRSQEKLIIQSINTIQSQVIDYIKGYEKSFLKNRTTKDKKYKFSSLCNYHKELELV
ncbi:hypothetical protein [Tissierella pigra]|uniref:Uncharacterized protein n=1 Tax=Tissierella pigra TaxID=2607614 RepID=A0A6N7XWG3_9FIRM|nr:hypothetical protein [Tissierella pigra]MSU02147.1 hypothetical protein [Tissierella pigra]